VRGLLNNERMVIRPGYDRLRGKLLLLLGKMFVSLCEALSSEIIIRAKALRSNSNEIFLNQTGSAGTVGEASHGHIAGFDVGPCYCWLHGWL
jgi:hypothetical protein